MKLYVANAMRGKEHFNFPWFEAAAKVLRAKGHEVVNPTEIDEKYGVVDVSRLADGTIWSVRLSHSYDFEQVIRRDLDAVRECDGIVLGPDWAESEGARMERDAAILHDLAVFYGVESVHDVSWQALSATAPDPHQIAPDIAGRDVAGTMYPILDRVDLLRHQQRTHQEQTAYTEEVRVIDPVTGGAKGSKLARFDLLPPDALWAVAEHFGLGAEKYEDRNWEKGYSWGLSYAALQRHLTEFWAGEDIDEDSGGFHLAAAAVHCLFLLAFQMRGAGTDDRSKVMGD